jgi:hypothetical protein
MTDTSRRFDIYRLAHKGLRACLAHALAATGRLDTLDAEDTAAALAHVRTLVTLCRVHLEHEETYLHAAMQARRPGSAAETARDHAHHRKDFVLLQRAALDVEAALGAQRAAAAHRLYRLLAQFVADNLAHMEVEESHNNTVLWAEYSDAELLELQQRLAASIAPDLKIEFMRWMIPAMAPAERAELLAGMRAGMSADGFDALLVSIKPHLTARDWFKLQLALGSMARAA